MARLLDDTNQRQRARDAASLRRLAKNAEEIGAVEQAARWRDEAAELEDGLPKARVEEARAAYRRPDATE